ncbi:MAG: tRNA preQ1(34) S-adenosylmethionine ribosyltransferase-isomerase QueA [Oculatellaceae cyanobacterium bins.114]|nr:tRNA preQ1(34) S-adenosylmethionine ribosyltransferase-isomerase QueA [Oculatellaceae cyanobacterium bins.114]
MTETHLNQDISKVWEHQTDAAEAIAIHAEDLQLHAYDYELPPEQIAQNPAVPRDTSRLLVVKSLTEHQHHIFRDLPDLLQPGDLLVLNNTQVIPARLFGRTGTGARVEVLLLEEQTPHQWLALVKPGKRLKVGTQIYFGVESAQRDGNTTEPWLEATVIARDEATGGRILAFTVPSGRSLLAVVQQLGEVPLPPYISQSQATAEQYQTVYAEHAGSVAAPTAGLHFTPELLTRLQERGIQQAFITLHVGIGTFRPVEVEDITTHQMHGEWLEIPADVVAQINQTKANGGRVIAVGTTATRALEGGAQAETLQPYCGKTELFIYPGYRWRVVDGLITNFHLPKSSLMMLVSALIGRSRLLALYQEAIVQHYRFYSFGDAMLILPDARVSERMQASR